MNAEVIGGSLFLLLFASFGLVAEHAASLVREVVANLPGLLLLSGCTALLLLLLH